MKIGSKTVLALAAALTVGGAATAADISSWTKPYAPFRMIGDVCYVGTAGLSAFLITTPKGDILVDAALPQSGPMIEENIEKLGFKLSDVKILLNSHAHLDHAGGLAELKKDTGATLIASAGDKPLLETGTYPGRVGDKASGFPPVKVDRVIGDGETVSLGGVTPHRPHHPRPHARLHHLDLSGGGRRCDAPGGDLL